MVTITVRFLQLKTKTKQGCCFAPPASTILVLVAIHVAWCMLRALCGTRMLQERKKKKEQRTQKRKQESRKESKTE
jgi:phenylalanyl-tRNA synthetase beta subunit